MFPFFEIAARLFPAIISAFTDPKTIKNSEAMKSAVDAAVREITKANTPEEAEKNWKNRIYLSPLGQN